MERYSIVSNLLVVAPEFAGKDFKWIDTFSATHLSGHIEKVNILVFNVKTTDEIKPMLEQELKRLQMLDAPKEIDVHNQAYLQNLLNELEDDICKKEIPQPLLDAVSNSAGRRFTKDDVIYLSAISGRID